MLLPIDHPWLNYEYRHAVPADRVSMRVGPRSS